MVKRRKSVLSAVTVKTRPMLIQLLAKLAITPQEIIGSGRSLEVILKDDRDYNKFTRCINNPFAGYKTGWGGWVVKLSPLYPLASSLDFCDKASPYHY